MEPDSLWPGSLRDAAADPFEAPGAACGAGCQRRLHRGPSQRLAGELLGCGVDVAGAHRLSGPFKHARDRLEHRAGTGRGVPWLARSRCRFREEPLVNQGQLGELKLESRVRTCPVIFLKAGAGRAGFGEGALDYSRRRLRKDGRLRVERVAGYADEGHWAWASGPGPVWGGTSKGQKSTEGIDAVLASVAHDAPYTPSPADVAVYGTTSIALHPRGDVVGDSDLRFGSVVAAADVGFELRLEGLRRGQGGRGGLASLSVGVPVVEADAGPSTPEPGVVVDGHT